jgi:hypothetical protein
MFLYHFTSLYNLKNVGPENILAFGLKAAPCDWVDVLGYVDDCVWLTNDPDLPPQHSSSSEVRITVVIPSADRRLVHLPALMRKRYGPTIEPTTTSRTFYLYLGNIPLTSLRAVDYGNAANRARGAVD